MASDCLFCGIVEGSVPSQTIDSDERTVSFMDINPATRGHALVIPRAHSAGPDGDRARGPGGDDRSPRSGWRSGWRRRSTPTASTSSTPAAPAAWQTVFHFHMHVIPRYEDDPLKLPWIPRGGDEDEIAAIAAKLRGDDG